MNNRKTVRRKRTTRACQLTQLMAPDFFKALCDPNRIAIVALLARADQPRPVGQIGQCCPVDLSVVSRHLSLLKRAGILKAEKAGKEVHYSVRSKDLVKTLRQLADAVEQCCPTAKATGGRHGTR